MTEISLASGDVVVAVLAAERGLLDPVKLDALTDQVLEQRAQGRSASLLGVLVDQGLISAGQASELKRLRAERGRHCSACGETTYLLPGEDVATKACEQCGAGLGGQAAPAALDPASAPTVIETPPASPAGPQPAGQLIGQGAPRPIPPPPPPSGRGQLPPAGPAKPAPRFAPPPEALAAVAGRPAAPPEPLWAQVGEILTFPVRSGGSVALTLLGGVFAFVAQFVPIIVFPAFIPLLGWVWSYYAKVTSAATRGDRELPDFPDLDIGGMFGMFITGLGVALACFWPIGVAAIMTAIEPTFWPLWLTFSLVVYLAGLVYLPLAWLMTTTYQNVGMAFSYRTGLSAALAAPGDYVLLLVLGIATSVGVAAFKLGAAFLPPGISSVASALIGFYGSLVLSTAVGRFYYANAARIGWFSVPTRASAPAPARRPATQPGTPAPHAPSAPVAHAPPTGAPHPPSGLGVPVSGPRAPVASIGAVRSARGEAISGDALKEDAIRLVKHPVTLCAVAALAVLLIVKAVVHKDWYVTSQEASRVSRERGVPLVVWRHGAADRTKDEFREQLQSKTLKIYEFVTYEQEVPGAPDSGTPSELTISKSDGTQVAYFRPAAEGFTLAQVAEAIKTASGR